MSPRVLLIGVTLMNTLILLILLYRSYDTAAENTPNLKYRRMKVVY